MPPLTVSRDTVARDAAPAVMLEGLQADTGGAPPEPPAVSAGDPNAIPAVADKLRRRVSLSLVASLCLHAGALAIALYLGLQAADVPATGEDGVAVEIVAAEAGAASAQDTASGTEATPSESATTETQPVEAPPTETAAEPPPPRPVETTVEPPPEAPQPVTEQAEAPPPPETPQPQQVAEAPPPVVQPDPVPVATTTEVAPVQALVTPAPTPPTPVTQPVIRREPPPVVRREQRPVRVQVTPPRREPVTERRPPQPVQAAARRSAPAGEGTGMRNSQAAVGNASSGGSQASAAAVANYRQRVLAHLARFKVYPDQARERGIVGRAVIAFTLSRGGQLAASSLAGSSGAAILDQATVAMLRRAVPFPAMPEGGPMTMSFTAGIRYDLR
ncbi:energy transducer TonB [Phreatobacter stygius]|uniref:TonB family protein n=1 Tax=Phreatobacter stygius TaxID=1940610 RepID=A0A4D7B2X2_9HYPH|nr:energy transducer TonB [Phreatobacter stygius]QCI67884.1 TonB family protein [Phreatobacter stygius]